MKKRLFSLLLALLLMCSVSVTAFASTGRNPIEQATHGTVAVYSDIQLSDGTDASSVGTGFGVGVNGEKATYFITNRHVITAENEDGSLTQAKRVYIMQGQNSIKITNYYLEIGDTLYYSHTDFDANLNKMVECDVIAISSEYDIAILKPLTPVENRIALDLAESASEASVAQAVYALGYPAISTEVASTTNVEFTGNYYDFTEDGVSYSLPIYAESRAYHSDISDVTVTTGTVSRFTTMASRNNVRVIQHDATIHDGNSGGPLVDASGRVVGVNTYSAAGSESLNYAINVDYVRSFCEANGVEVDVPSGSGFPLIPVLIGAAVLVAAAVVAAVLILRRRGRGKAAPVAAPAVPPLPVQPAPVIANDSGFRIQGVTGRYAGKRYAINGTVRIGRDANQCQIVYPEGSQGISRVHCELIAQNGRLYLRDLGASYGTFLKNGQRLASNQVVELRGGEQFYLASPQETFQIGTRGGV